MISKTIFFASYILASMFMLIVLASHPDAKDVFQNWWTWYLPVAGALALSLGYVLYRGLMAAIDL